MSGERERVRGRKSFPPLTAIAKAPRRPHPSPGMSLVKWLPIVGGEGAKRQRNKGRIAKVAVLP